MWSRYKLFLTSRGILELIEWITTKSHINVSCVTGVSCLIKELFVNLMILMSCLFLYHQLTRQYSHPYRRRKRELLLMGVLAGVLGIILMMFSIRMNDIILIDLRHIPILLVTIHGGWVPMVISSVIIITTRFFFGVGLSTFFNIVFILLSGIIFVYFAKKIKHIWLLTFVVLFLSNTIFSVVMFLSIADFTVYLNLMVSYWFISFVAGFIAVYLNNYLRKTKQLFQEYERNAYTDSLTGLNNVRSFDLAINRMKEKAWKNKRSIGFIVMDVDYFKQINDTYGHPEGDVILKGVATELQFLARESDVVSRNGGEEFTILVPTCSHQEVLNFAEDIRRHIEATPFYIYNHLQEIHITLSIGVATYPEHAIEMDQLYHKADEALYQAKRSGRNRVCSYQVIPFNEQIPKKY